jgi:hypothetical protein
MDWRESNHVTCVFSVVLAMFSVRHQNCEHVYNIRCFLCLVRTEALHRTTKVVFE